MKTSLKNRLRVLYNFFALTPSHPVPWKERSSVGTEEAGLRPIWDRESKTYRLAVPVLKSTHNLVISRCSCAWTARKCTKKRDTRAAFLFCSLNLLLFWRFRCRRRRSFVRSLLLTARLLSTAGLENQSSKQKSSKTFEVSISWVRLVRLLSPADSVVIWQW